MSENNIIEYIDSVMSKIDVPDDQKMQIENELLRYVMNNIENTAEPETYHHKKHHHVYPGEFMQELNHLNLKLLYIPLIQITSGTTRLVMPLFDDDDD